MTSTTNLLIGTSGFDYPEMKADTEELKAMFKESHELESEIEKQLSGLKFIK